MLLLSTYANINKEIKKCLLYEMYLLIRSLQRYRITVGNERVKRIGLHPLCTRCFFFGFVFVQLSAIMNTRTDPQHQHLGAEGNLIAIAIAIAHQQVQQRFKV